MTVLEFLEHLAAQVEEFTASDIFRNPAAIAGAHFLPVDVLVGKEAIVFIEDCPQGIKVSVWVIFPLHLLMTCRER